MKRAPDPYLRTCPWKIMFVWSPLETVLDQIEKDGTVDTDGKLYFGNDRLDLLDRHATKSS